MATLICFTVYLIPTQAEQIMELPHKCVRRQRYQHPLEVVARVRIKGHAVADAVAEAPKGVARALLYIVRPFPSFLLRHSTIPFISAIISQTIQLLLKWHLTFLLFLQYNLNVSELLARLVMISAVIVICQVT